MSQKLSFRDFVPEDQTRFLGLSRKYEPLEELMERVNRWIEENEVEVLEIETLVVPGRPDKKKKGKTTGGTLQLSELSRSDWHQVIRLWYRSEVEAPPPKAEVPPIRPSN